MVLSEVRKSFRIGFAVLIQYRSVTASQSPSHVVVAITLNAKASSLKITSCALAQHCYNGDVSFLWETPCKIETLEQIDAQFVRTDYVHEVNVCSKFGKNPFTGDFWAKG